LAVGQCNMIIAFENSHKSCFSMLDMYCYGLFVLNYDGNTTRGKLSSLFTRCGMPIISRWTKKESKLAGKLAGFLIYSTMHYFGW
jgi:hypothetical protein